MSRFSRRRWIKLLRLPALALLMLAVLVNPVLAAVGDLHESSLGGAEHSLPADGHGREGGAGAGEGDLLHALMHAAHCCGHLTAILSTPLISQQALFSGAAPVPAFAAPHSPPYTDHFRPPIAV